ncbi:hypothetical protein SLA2020_181730 [Shorea laevis]
MASDDIQITFTEDNNGNLKRSGKSDVGPLTSNKPLNEVPITEDEIKKFKLLRDADTAPSTSNKPLIQKVPKILRSCYGEDCERFFKHTSVVIGPLNHQRETEKDSRVERGEKCKLKLAAMFIKDGKEEDFYKNVKKEIKNLRNCYEKEAVEKWNDEELAWMFLVDGCALLQFIALDVYDAWNLFSNNDPVSIEKVDFFLLENQLPYQLLQILMDSFAEFSSAELRPKLEELFKDLINEFINKSFLSLSPQQTHQIEIIDYIQPRPPLHLLDLLQRRLTIDYFRPPPFLLDLLRRRLMGEKGEKQEPINKDGFWKTLTDDNSCSVPNKSKHWPSIRNVKELKDKGIRLKAREKGGAITDIDFNDRFCMATLTLAPIFLHNTTVPLLLNLMAYELCPDFKEDCKITSHLSFLDSLIDNGEDVKELRDAGVLHHGLGSDEAVAELFNKISDMLVPNLTIDLELRRGINAYCDKSHFSGLRASVEANLTQTYFRSPWSFLVFLGALAGLIMTGMQTYYSLPGNKHQ